MLQVREGHSWIRYDLMWLTITNSKFQWQVLSAGSLYVFRLDAGKQVKSNQNNPFQTLVQQVTFIMRILVLIKKLRIN